MLIVVLIDIIVAASLIIAGRRSVESALPLFAFYLVLLPHESRLVIPGGFDVSTDRVAIIVMLGLFILRRVDRRPDGIPLARLIWFNIACGLCSTIGSLSIATSAKLLIGQIVEYYLLYFMIVRVVSNRRTIHNVMLAMAMAMGVCCVCGLFESYARWSILSVFPSNLWVTYGRATTPLYIEWGRGLRIRSTFPHPILFGDALAMMIPIVVYLLTISKSKVQWVLLWLVLILSCWAIYKTSSRGPWIVAAGSCILLFVMFTNRVRKYLIGIAFVACLVLVTRPGIWQTVGNLYESTLDPSSVVGSSYQYRDAVAQAVRDAVGQSTGRTAFGYGLGTFRELGLEMNFLNGWHRWHTCDNNWALFLYETGYVGLLGTAMLLFKPLLMMIRSYWKIRGPERHWLGVLFISVGGFYFSLLSVAGYDWGQQGFMLWIVIGLSVVYPRLLEKSRDPGSSPVAPLRRLLPQTETLGAKLIYG
jgi:hypothetical protein